MSGQTVGFVGIGLGSPGQPHILVRYMSIDDPRNLRSAAWIGTFWNVLLGLGALTIGLVGRAFWPLVENLPEAPGGQLGGSTTTGGVVRETNGLVGHDASLRRISAATSSRSSPQSERRSSITRCSIPAPSSNARASR